MNIYVQQSIEINILRINNISFSSVLQIGTAGVIKAQTTAENSGGFTEQAPDMVHNGFVEPSDDVPLLVPLHTR